MPSRTSILTGAIALPILTGFNNFLLATCRGYDLEASADQGLQMAALTLASIGAIGAWWLFAQGVAEDLRENRELAAYHTQQQALNCRPSVAAA